MTPKTVAKSGWEELLAEADACRDAQRYQALARRARRLAAQGLPAPNHSHLRLALLGGASTELIESPLELALRVAGFEPELHVAPYDVFRQEMLDPESATSRFEPRVAVLIVTAHNLLAVPRPGANASDADAAADAACSHLFDACSCLHDRCGSEIVLNTLAPVSLRPLGNLAPKSPEDTNNFIRRVNVRLGDLAPSYVHLNDIAALVERQGLDSWIDLRLWHEAKQPVAPESIPELARNTAAIVGGILGRSRKCLVLDLDNTLWGGVVGDVGVEGIEIGEGTGVGEAYKTFQLHLRALKERGILLAVCSKNEDRLARQPFEEHPEMVLRFEDFVAFRANWDPKSDNLRAIATQLNIGLDSFVFLDDNPAEREEVRQALPEVLVPEISDDPADYPKTLDEARCFEVTAITGEDRRRSEMYRSQTQRSELQASTRDLSEFLVSLDMKAEIKPLEPMSLARVTQLINKTNQFNLTTRRLTRAEVEALHNDSSCLTRTVRLTDRFGDHGLISVLFGHVEGDTLIVDGWLMSCRVLKRGVERLLLNEVAAAAKERHLARIFGTYIPTDRNALVKDHYSDLGFQTKGNENDATKWCLDLGGFEPLSNFISLI